MSRFFSAFQKTGRRPLFVVGNGFLLLMSLLWLLTSSVQGQTAAVDPPLLMVDSSAEMALATTAAITETGFPLSASYGWISNDNRTADGLDWGDMDRDGYLDLAVAYETVVKVYVNVKGRLQPTMTWQSTDGGGSNVAWGDVDGDGDLDL
ncbi:MAG: VCBS repeat-containing protein, partial [Anaerolineales bacterium]|nr:VCBS repeat-containing protein [Anaerolineales bacterium]